MIGQLKGRLESTEDGIALIDCGGVGYSVHCGQHYLAGLEMGETIKLIIETQVREDAITLFGFRSASERNWFRLLVSVQRVGSKMAILMLDRLGTQALQQAIISEDVTLISSVPGVGKKLAERIVTELKEKALKTPVSADAMSQLTDLAAIPVGHAERDAVQALTNLGFSRQDALSAIAKAKAKLSENAKEEDLLKASLQELAA